MNKAFTKEDDGEGPDPLGEEPWPLPPGVLNYMTPTGAQALRAELAERVLLLARAQDPGARREHSRRIRALERRLREGQVVEPAAQPTDRVTFGARVRTRDADDVEHVYHLVGVDEAAPAQGRVSWQSALARALIGHSVGEVVTVRAPGGARELEILAIERVL